MEHRGEKEKALNEMKSQIESLTVQLTSAKKDASEAIARMELLNSEMKSYQLNASSATVSSFSFNPHTILGVC
jgi:nucleoprotein TPR